ncbi:MAG: IS1096 element passenger TnpR family protein [Shewanella oncorhynchi]
MKSYVIKIAVRGVSPMVWRLMRISADTSLATLHFIFQIVQSWGGDHLHQFHIYGKDYGISYATPSANGAISLPPTDFCNRAG